MSESIRTVLRENAGKMKPGDVFVVNAPYWRYAPARCHRHHADFRRRGSDILFFVASRDPRISVASPLVPCRRQQVVEEEGILFDNFMLVDGGEFWRTTTQTPRRSSLSGSNPINIADLKAQIAAGAKGVQEVHKMIDQFGLDVVHAYMRHARQPRKSRFVIIDVARREFTCQTDSAEIKVKISFNKENDRPRSTLRHGDQRPSNNAIRGGAFGGLAVFRCWSTTRSPNEGWETDRYHHSGRLHARTEISGCGGSGNIETSGVTDTLFGALRVQAASKAR